MHVYLSAAPAQRPELQLVIEQMRGLGHRVRSLWAYGMTEPDKLDPQATDEDSACLACCEIWAALEQSDLFIQFGAGVGITLPPAQAVEFGFALGLGKRVWIVGQPEHLWHTLPKVRQFDDAAHMLKILAVQEPMPAQQQETSSGGAIVASSR